MAKVSVFKTDFGGTTHAPDPEALFRDLRGRAPEIKHLWSHQADLLRAYYQRFQAARDVAIELPTGAGKTLVGLLIAEHRRQALNERVAYLCPTRQLARQVGALSRKYGIKAYVFVGRQRDYPPLEFSEFQASHAIAVTTYSAVFNTNPRINDAQAIILDDAHASENYISSLWSVEITRAASEDLYRSIINLLQDGLPAAFLGDVTDNSEGGTRRTNVVELVPGRYVRQHTSAIRGLLDTNLAAETPSWYSWGLIKEHVPACSFFVSQESILIRPFLPPALAHPPFNQANQRIYMSATLGAGGELERITGVHAIQRLPLPAGWDKRGSGRRLFLMPQVALSDDDGMRVALDAVQDSGRSLVLVPSQQEAIGFVNELKRTGQTVLGASDIEDSIEPFVTSTKTTLVLSRYDGLDLPDDACRLLVMGGLPSGTNLQERFLWSRIAAYSLLRDRVLTRFTQGVGRCTRSDNDYAVVVVWGRPLVDFILKHENRQILNPELQAELEFGIGNSKDKKLDDFKALWRAFLDHGDDWKDAEAAIVAMREQRVRRDDPTSQRLASAVSDEVAYLYAMWSGDYEGALQRARSVADLLGGDETKGYRGWWYYLAADAAIAIHDAGGDAGLLETAKDYLQRASSCCVAISWFARLARSTRSATEPAEAGEETAAAVERIRDQLTYWGAVGTRFEQAVTQAVADIQATGHRQFHRGLKALGEMLGFRADLPESDGAPDCIWSIGSDIYVAHEAKSDHTPGDPIGINDIRQAQSHEDWVQANRPCGTTTKILCVIESPRDRIAADAMPHAKSLCHVFPAQMKVLLEQVTSVLRRFRSTVSDISDEKVLEQLHREISAARLTPSDVIQTLSARPVSGMTKGGSQTRENRSGR